MSEFEQTVLAELQKLHQRFDHVDQRFDQVDQRFEQVDRRFEQVDRRFEGLDEAMLETRHQLRLLGLEFERFRSDQQVQKEVLLELRDQNLHQRLSNLEKRAF